MHTIATRWDVWAGWWVIMVSVHRPDFVVVVPALISRVAGGGSSFSGMEAEFAAASVDYA